MCVCVCLCECVGVCVCACVTFHRARAARHAKDAPSAIARRFSQCADGLPLHGQPWIGPVDDAQDGPFCMHRRTGARHQGGPARGVPQAGADSIAGGRLIADGNGDSTHTYTHTHTHTHTHITDGDGDKGPRRDACRGCLNVAQGQQQTNRYRGHDAAADPNAAQDARRAPDAFVLEMRVNMKARTKLMSPGCRSPRWHAALQKMGLKDAGGDRFGACARAS